MAYRIGAKLRDVDSFQYHPTGIAHPPHLAGALISEAVRSAGTKLVNGLGERFVDELNRATLLPLRFCANAAKAAAWYVMVKSAYSSTPRA